MADYKIKNADLISRAINDRGYSRFKDDMRAKEKRHGKKSNQILEEQDKQEQERRAAVCLEVLRQLPGLSLTERGRALQKNCLEILKDTDYSKQYSEEFLELERRWELEEKTKGGGNGSR